MQNNFQSLEQAGRSAGLSAVKPHEGLQRVANTRCQILKAASMRGHRFIQMSLPNPGGRGCLPIGGIQDTNHAVNTTRSYSFP
jgi:hypothetical protein